MVWVYGNINRGKTEMDDFFEENLLFIFLILCSLNAQLHFNLVTRIPFCFLSYLFLKMKLELIYLHRHFMLSELEWSYRLNLRSKQVSLFILISLLENGANFIIFPCNLCICGIYGNVSSSCVAPWWNVWGSLLVTDFSGAQVSHKQLHGVFM